MNTQFLQKFFEPGDVFEIRVLEAERPGYYRPHIESGYFDYNHIEDIPQYLDEFTNYVGAYYTINPVNDALHARVHNELRPAKRNNTTSDNEIKKRNWLFVDVDCNRPSGISATKEEKQEAWKLVEKVKKHLSGWPSPIIVDSGNGYYLYYRVDLPTQDNGIIANILHELKKLNTDYAHIDQAVYNPARIARLPGTWNRKGADVPERPHRISAVVEFPDNVETVNNVNLKKYASRQQEIQHKKNSYDDLDIIENYNKGNNLEKLLDTHGWKLLCTDPDGQQKWRRPGKSQGSHSATYNGEVFYVFSNNCPPFAPGTGYSPFSVFALLNHDGDKKSAFRALSGHESGELTNGSVYNGVDLAHILKKYKNNIKKFPEKFFNVPGIIGDVVKYCIETAPRPQPILSLGGAIALMSVLTGRKVCTEENMRSNVYVVSVAKSCAGKNRPREINKQILILSNQPELVGPEEVTSGAAIVAALDVSPTLLLQFDEFGRTLKTTSNPQANSHLYNINTQLMQLFTSSNTHYFAKGYANTENNIDINQPHATIYASTTPAPLFDGLNSDSLQDGYLGRMLFFISTERPFPQKTPMIKIPERIIKVAQYWKQFSPGGNLSSINPEPAIVPNTNKSDKIFLDYTKKCEKLMDENEHYASIWGRCMENAKKLSLIYACSARPKQPEINADAASWGCALAHWLTKNFAEICERWISDNEFDKLQNEIIRFIEKNCKVTKTDLAREFRKIPAATRNRIITNLEEAEIIKQYKVNNKKRGKNPNVYKMVR